MQDSWSHDSQSFHLWSLCNSRENFVSLTLTIPISIIFVNMKHLPLLLAFTSLLSCGEMMKPKTELKLKDKEVFEFQLLQRTSKSLPAQHGKVEVAIGDITGGQTWLTISKDSVSVYEKSIHEGDTLKFSIDDTKYKITCLEMINNLIGDDMATFSVFE